MEQIKNQNKKILKIRKDMISSKFLLPVPSKMIIY